MSNPNQDAFIPYSRQWLTEEDIEEVVRVLRSNWITQGPNIKALH